MSMTSESRNTGRYAVMRTLAPHVDELWASSFVVELRLLGVEGAHIGEALTEIESYCGESGQSPQHAFGEPVECARNLQLPSDGWHSPRTTLRFLIPASVQALGMFILVWGFDGWLRGQRLEVTVGHLVVAAVFVHAVIALVRYADSILRWAVSHPKLFPLVSTLLPFLAGLAVLLFALRCLHEVIWLAPPGWGLGAGAAAMLAGDMWAIARLGTPGSGEDPVTSPFEHAGTPSTGEAPRSPGKLSRDSLICTLLDTALIPAGTVLLLATTFLLHLVSAR